MGENLKNNPFAQLFSSLDAAKNYAEKCEEQGQVSMEIDKQLEVSVNDQSQNIAVKEIPDPILSQIPQQHVCLNDMIEKIFGISFNKETGNCVVFLEDVANDSKQVWIDMNSLEQALFERLLLDDPLRHLLNYSKQAGRNFIAEKNVITYLYHCYQNVMEILNSRKSSANENLHTMISLVLRNMATALKQPELYSEQDLAAQLLVLFADEHNVQSITFGSSMQFLHKLVDEIIKDEDKPEEMLYQVLLPLLNLIKNEMKGATITSYPRFKIFGSIVALSYNKHTANALIDFNMPANKPSGSVYEETLFGQILQLSCIPKTSTEEVFFFKKGDVNSHVETVVWSAINNVHSFVYSILFQLLKVSPIVKEKVIQWISDCLVANEHRGKLQSMLNDPMSLLAVKRCVSDAFMINLSAVLLRLCEPIISDRSQQKILKIDPTYGASEIFKKETCLIPAEDPENRLQADSYSFVTKIFFLCQRSVALGFAVCCKRLGEMNQTLQRLYSTLRDAGAEGGARNENVEALQERFTSDSARFLCLRAALLEPKYQDLLFDLNVATCNLIIQVLLESAPSPRTDYCVTKLRQLTFPLVENVPATFACIPELILENFNNFLPFLKRFNPSKLEERGPAGLESILTCIIVLTRGNKRVKNPHLRAGLTESLEALLPSADDTPTFWRQQVFQEHPHCKELVASLLDVYVGIEMTGESVEDYKFKYRLAMSLVMEFLWKMEIHRECFKKLALEAEQNIEAVNPPIFLRFLNLLINDAVYLLDEALAKMAALRAMQAARDAGEWQNMATQERSQAMTEFNQTGMIARSNNVLSKCTIRTLEILTEEIKSIFSHPTIVDRITAMLNLNLQHLVGPNKKNLKVKDQEDYGFKPIDIVLSICHIYANLSDSEAFCLAISQDGRSYNDKLFVQAEEVLFRIGGSSLVPEIRAVASRVAESARKQKTQDELLADAPDEYLDPIMNTIMMDPVILPSSHVTVDRHTISRHLLSDQTDPFNRAPLTMEMVTPNVELKQKILAWMEGRQGKSSKIN